MTLGASRSDFGETSQVHPSYIPPMPTIQVYNYAHLHSPLSPHNRFSNRSQLLKPDNSTMTQLPTLPPSLLPPPEGKETADQLNIMRAGQSYGAGDPYLIRLRDRGQVILEEFEKFKSNTTKRMEYMRKVCVFEDAEGENDVAVMPGFTCEYVSGSKARERQTRGSTTK